jgi:hypothetical protein
MKANEAPEKIYMSPAGVLYKGDKQQCNDIEYTRTNAFIEKACDFISSLRRLDDDVIEDFKNYMKGE